jgi:CheY-like chemotaxis protein
MAAEGAKHKVVVVEDEGLIAADLEARLKTAGYIVPGTADSAPKALQLIRKSAPDVVLMDIRLKGSVDGIEIADQVRAQMDIPVVFLTAYEDRATLERAGRSQAFGYIKKPIASASLKGSIEMAIAKHRYERDLRAQRDWAISSFAAVPYAVLVTDSQGRVTYLNSRAEELTGSTADDALGRHCWELLRLYSRETGNPIQDFIPVAMLHGQPVTLPDGIYHKRDANRSYVVEGTVAPRWRDGRMEGTVVALSDVTRAVFDQEQARQEQKHEALMRLAEGIVSQLGDWARVVEESPRLLAALPAGAPLRRDVEAIERAAMDALATATRLQAFLQTPEVEAKAVDACAILRQLETAWKLIEPRLQLALDLEAAPVQADTWQLTRALVSILLHARSRMKSDSALRVELSGAEAEQVIHSVRIRVSYATTEDAAAIAQVFEPRWTSASQDLYTAYKLLKKMGGLVSARLERRDTAIFDLYLRRVKAAAAGVAAPRQDEPAVLLVDANPEVRRLMHTHFERNGYKLLATAGCEEAVLLAELYPGQIPLAIANLARGDEARDWLTGQLASIRPQIGVRLLSGYTEAREAAAGEAFEPAAERHLTKWDLAEWAREALARDRKGI